MYKQKMQILPSAVIFLFKKLSLKIVKSRKMSKVK